MKKEYLKVERKSYRIGIERISYQKEESVSGIGVERKKERKNRRIGKKIKR